MLDKMTSPNAFGEAIRDIAFVKHNEGDYGCYSTFDMVDGFEEIEPDSEIGKRLFAFLLGDYCCDGFGGALCTDEDREDVEWLLGACSMYSNGELHVAWYWDGDGVLVVGCGDKYAINNDCKKSHRWSWVR